MIILQAIIVLVNFIGAFIDSHPTAIVKTTTGPVKGLILLTGPNSLPYAAFKGIRYGRAPTGYFRFKPPLPVVPWTKTLHATVEGDPCPQIDPLSQKFVGSEDCLFLNVYTPVTDLGCPPTTLKSAVVWIYGGRFTQGSGTTKFLKPDYLLEKDVVFVSFNYRLGALGFLSLNHPNATGNAGLKDQILALKWVQSNIAKFGGNPKNVTLLGHSAGSVAAGYHMISAASTGLFHGVIAMSGNPIAPAGYQSPEEAMRVAGKLTRQMGLVSYDKDLMLEAFYRATPSQLVNAVTTIGSLTTLTPTHEDASFAVDPIITESPYRRYRSGNYTKVPIMLGFMQQETLSFTLSAPMMLELIDLGIAEAKQIGYKAPKNVAKNVKFILDGGNFNQLDPNIVQAVVNFTTNILFVRPTDRTRRFFTDDNDLNSVYYYHISFYTNPRFYHMDDPHTILGAGHGDERAYIFYIPDDYVITDPNDPLSLTISRVSSMWTNFVKYGNPTPDWIDKNSVGITWPNSGPGGFALNIGNELIVDPRPINDDVELMILLDNFHAERTL